MGSASQKLNLPPGIGRAGEAAARVYVTAELGYEIVETNFRTREGEIDIIAKSDSTLVFIEVKTRTNQKFGFGVEQISSRKAQRLQATALRYLEKTSDFDVDWRIDLLSLRMTKSGQVLHVDHIRNAIEE
ncbi:MAG: YraN family protein [Chloroflexi bacterium]|nr:YraN family protein [Chloroflexota bacterium]